MPKLYSGVGGMKGMAWLWPSLALSPDVWPASDPEPGLGRKAEEGGQQRVCSPWVGSATLGLANGPAAIRLVCRYAGGHCSGPRRRGGGRLGYLKKKKGPGLDNCEARVARPTPGLTSAHSVPRSLTIRLSSSQRSRASGAETAAG